MNTTDRRFCIRFIDEVLEKIFDEIKTYDLKTKELVYNEFEKAIFENCFKEYIYCLNLSWVCVLCFFQESGCFWDSRLRPQCGQFTVNLRKIVRFYPNYIL